ncbi:MAG: glycosyltransferase, partial [Candidatus Sulfotelmatobacter sp.]
HLSSATLGDEMRNADVFLLPSVVEGNPQVILQASACGLPCIIMNLYRSEYVADGRTGFQAQSDAELSARLDTLLADANLRRSFGAAAADHALQFDWDDIAGQWANEFRNAMGQPRVRDRQQDLLPDLTKELLIK